VKEFMESLKYTAEPIFRDSSMKSMYKKGLEPFFANSLSSLPDFQSFQRAGWCDLLALRLAMTPGMILTIVLLSYSTAVF
jgi:hypothetical protein